jgi:hypothetical protein
MARLEWLRGEACVKRAFPTAFTVLTMLLLAVALVGLQCPQVACAGCAGDEPVAKQTGLAVMAPVLGVLPVALVSADVTCVTSESSTDAVSSVELSVRCSRLLI